MLLECNSLEMMENMLKVGANSLLEWFTWVKPWSSSKPFDNYVIITTLNIAGGLEAHSMRLPRFVGWS